uniref:Uncharacterized protein LOC111136848 n=1 Tax=Crassostrea virginica TaxID=6565 RepID=A0A8B8EUP4_CRAVI|nr:uncharacterized protein LOC111136848 [Crassostrea virginica]
MDPPGNTNITLLLAPCIPTFNIRYIDWNNQIKGNQSSCQQFTAEGCDAALRGYPAPPHVPRPLSLSNDLIQSQSTQRITGGKWNKTYLIDTSRGITKGMVSDRENSLLMLATYIDTEPGIDAPLPRPLVPCRVVKQVGGPLISCIAGAGVYHLKEHATTSSDRHQQEWGLFH